MRAAPLLRRLLSAALALGALGFVAWTVARNWAELQRYPWSVDGRMLLASMVALLATLAWGVFVWGRVLARFQGARGGYPSLLSIWFLSSLARYIPGKVWQFVAAAQLGRRAGLPAAVLLTSLAVHMGFGVLSAAIVAALTVPPPLAGIPFGRGPLAILLLAGALVAVHPGVINFGLRLIPRALHRQVLRWSGGWADGVLLLSLSALFWLLYAAAFYLFVRALMDAPIQALPFLGGVNALSFLAGYLVFLVPAGLGVRELAMTGLLGAGSAGWLGPEVASPEAVGAVISISSRLWITAAELIGAAALVVLFPRDGEGKNGPG